MRRTTLSTTTERHEQEMENGAPRPYRAPRLLVYGAMRDLTAAGTENRVERGANPGKL
jgi:hypothetical protein